MKTKVNPSLEEFSLQRFNPLKKALIKYYEEMKPVFEKNNWDAAVVNKMLSDTIDFMNKSVTDEVEYFGNDKVRLEFVLDYLILHFYARLISDLLSKSYKPEAMQYSKEVGTEISFDTAIGFLKSKKHWMVPLLKPMLDVITKRKVGDNTTNLFSYFVDKKSLERNIVEGAKHFFSLMPLPEYRELKKPKWNEASFTANGGNDPLHIFDLMNQIEYEINEKLKDKSILPSLEVDTEVPGYVEGESYSASKQRVLRKGKTLIEFADKAKWVDLQVPACSLEAASLEHCGNNYRAGETNLRVWSFRTPTDDPKFFVGRLTFIFNTDTKLIGEAKARNNQKPQSKFHPYIVELLLLPFVNGLEQGRHATHQDFAFADLSDELLMKLIEEKPTLFSKSKVGRAVIINRKLEDAWKTAYKKVTKEEAPDLETLKFDKN